MLFDDDTLHSISQSLWFERLKIMLFLTSQFPTTTNSSNSVVFLEELRIVINSSQLFTFLFIFLSSKEYLQLLCHSYNHNSLSVHKDIVPRVSNTKFCNICDGILIKSIVCKDSWGNTLNDDNTDGIIKRGIHN